MVADFLDFPEIKKPVKGLEPVDMLPLEVVLQNPEVVEMAQHMRRNYGEQAAENYLTVVRRVGEAPGHRKPHGLRPEPEEILAQLTDEWLTVGVIADKVFGVSRGRNEVNFCAKTLRQAVERGLCERKDDRLPHYRKLGAVERIVPVTPAVVRANPNPVRVYFDPSVISAPTPPQKLHGLRPIEDKEPQESLGSRTFTSFEEAAMDRQAEAYARIEAALEDLKANPRQMTVRDFIALAKTSIRTFYRSPFQKQFSELMAEIDRTVEGEEAVERGKKGARITKNHPTRQVAERAAQRAESALNKLIQSGRPFNTSDFIRLAGFSSGWLSKHPEWRDRVNRAKQESWGRNLEAMEGQEQPKPEVVAEPAPRVETTVAEQSEVEVEAIEQAPVTQEVSVEEFAEPVDSTEFEAELRKERDRLVGRSAMLREALLAIEFRMNAIDVLLKTY